MNEQKRIINFSVACVNEFAKTHNLNAKDAFRYLSEFKGIKFLTENYEAEHTLSFDTIMEDIGILCKRNGGSL